MAKKSIKRNYIYNVSYQVLTMLTPLITTPYVSRTLGAEKIGAFSYAESIVAYFTMFAAMGIASYGQREISYVQDEREKRTEVFWEMKTLSAITTLITLVIYFLFVGGQTNRILYLILTFNLLNVVADVTWLFQGMEEFGTIVFRNVVFKCINIAYIFIFIKSKDDIFIYAFGISFFTFLSNVSLWKRIKTLVDAPRISKIKPFRNLPAVISLFIPGIAISVYTVLDKTMIGVITGREYENGYYEQAIKLSRMVLTLVTSLGAVMVPRIGYHFEKKQIPEIQRCMYRAYRFVWFLGIPLCFGLIGISGNLVPWFYGPGFYKIKILLPVLSLLILAVGVSNITGIQYLIPTKRQNVLTLTVTVGALINFILNLWLIPKLQSLGAAVASVVAESIIAVLQLVMVRKELSVKQILISSVHYVLAGFIMSIVLWTESKIFAASIIYTILMIITGASVYFGTLYVMKDDFFVDNFKSIITKVLK